MVMSRSEISFVLLKAFVPALLVVVALSQMYRVFTGTTSPWKRGGFGMFSTIEIGSRRAIKVEVTDQNGVVYPISLEYSEDEGERRLRHRRRLRWYLYRETLNEMRAEPQRKTLEAFAGLILKRGEVLPLLQEDIEKIDRFDVFSDGSTPGLIKSETLPLGGANYYRLAERREAPDENTSVPVKVSLTVLRQKFDPATLKLSYEKIWEPIVILRPYEKNRISSNPVPDKNADLVADEGVTQ